MYNVIKVVNIFYFNDNNDIVLIKIKNVYLTVFFLIKKKKFYSHLNL